MDNTRRRFITQLAAAGLLLPFAGLVSAAHKRTLDGHYFSARADNVGRYFVSGFDARGTLLFDIPLPARGHDLSLHPMLNHLIIVARRPGMFLLVLDSNNGAILHHVESPPDRHFYGHSVFSADGRYLYTTENNIDNGHGIIGVRDAEAGYALVGELSSHGIGPHQFKLLSDKHTLVVANGGVLTRPETGRSKLNLDTMSPSLAYIDSVTGELLEEHRLAPALHQNSIRHLDINNDDQVLISMQYQGPATDQPPLIGLHRRGQAIKLLQAPPLMQQQMQNYCGSVCTDPGGHWFAVSSPRGNMITFWAANNGDYVGHVEVADGCGIAAGTENGEFLISSGKRGIYRYQLADKHIVELQQLHDFSARWDNHMTSTRQAQHRIT